MLKFFALLVLASLAPVALAEKEPALECDLYARGSWIVRFDKQKVKRVSVDNKAERLCKPFPSAGNENVKLELWSEGTILFEREFFLNLTSFHDTHDEKTKELSGGSLPSEEVVFNSFFPHQFTLKKRKIQLRLVQIEGSKLLGKGDL
ncbi:MAG TPA: hypothetical protein VIH99_11345 [Bdellovibrionota bacterium]|jgi:hypothetical protein